MGPVVAILGATATGKSSLAMRLADEIQGEIVNADALQVYRGFDIGTAKPTTEEQSAVPHHLIDILDPDEQYSAGDFVRRATAAIGEIQGRGRRPIVVGGSGFYVRSLLDGIGPLPKTDPVVRRTLGERLAVEGLPALRSELADIDPVTEARLTPGDSQRVLRALEVALSTGRPLSVWIAEQPEPQIAFPSLRIGLTLERPILYDRIEQRVARMLANGWVEEVESLLRAGLKVSVPAFQAIGYQQISRHLCSELSLLEAVQQTIGATRRFAKRQATWFRREKDVRWFAALEIEENAAPVVDLVCGRVRGG